MAAAVVAQPAVILQQPQAEQQPLPPPPKKKDETLKDFLFVVALGTVAYLGWYYLRGPGSKSKSGKDDTDTNNGGNNNGPPLPPEPPAFRYIGCYKSENDFNGRIAMHGPYTSFQDVLTKWKAVNPQLPYIAVIKQQSTPSGTSSPWWVFPFNDPSLTAAVASGCDTLMDGSYAIGCTNNYNVTACPLPRAWAVYYQAP